MKKSFPPVEVSPEDRARVALLNKLIAQLEAEIVGILAPYMGGIKGGKLAYREPDEKTQHFAARITTTDDGQTSLPKIVVFNDNIGVYEDPPGICRPPE